MNKRINELMDQSVETRIDIFSNEEYNAFSREKFAELIIRECTNILDELSELPDDIGGNAYLAAGSKKIKEHFGVE